jgi:dCMP deaminase
VVVLYGLRQKLKELVALKENGMPRKIDYAHLQVAETYSQLSHAIRLKVGAIVTKEDRVISIGYNGTPAGWDNSCEDHTYIDDMHVELKTKPEVIHAEANAIAKLAKSSEAGKDADMYITHAPCLDCAKLIYTAGIKKVFYRHAYRSTAGIEFLNKCKVEVEQL